jgi:hypothetical protein
MEEATMNPMHTRTRLVFTQGRLTLPKVLSGAFSLALLLYLLQPAGAIVPAQAMDDPRLAPQALAECPASISFGETVHCAIASASEEDRYSFNASAGDVVLARMSKATGDFYPQVAIEDSGGTSLCDQLSVTSAEVSSCTLSSGGAYTLVASNGFSGDHTGSYYLYLQRLNASGGATAMGFGQTLAGSIDVPAEMDAYTFSANAGDVVLARMSKTSGELYARVRLFGPDGAELDDQNSVTSAEIGGLALPSDGSYTLLASDGSNGTRTGAYSIYLQRPNAPGNASAISFGQTLPGSIAAPAEMAAYTFSASAGDVVLARMSKASGEIYARVRLFGPDGAELDDQNSVTSAEIGDYTLPGDGSYTLLASDGLEGVHTGTYYIYLQRLNVPGGTTAMDFGQTLAGSIEVPAEMDTYTFSANAGDVLLAQMSRASAVEELYSRLRLYGPDGAKLVDRTSVTMAEIEDYTLPSSGSYTLLASDGYDGTHTGAYSIYLQRPNAPGNASAISYGQTLTGSIAEPAEMDAYTFSASPGDVVQIGMNKSSGKLWPEIRLYGPDGELLSEDSGPGTAQIERLTLEVNGTCTLLAGDGFDGSYLGAYSLSLRRLVDLDLTTYLPLILKP